MVNFVVCWCVFPELLLHTHVTPVSVKWLNLLLAFDFEGLSGQDEHSKLWFVLMKVNGMVSIFFVEFLMGF